MRLSKNKLISLMSIGSICLGFSSISLASNYGGKLFVAGMGGHFAEASIEINTQADYPIAINELSKIDIGERSTHPTHDARIDVSDRNVMFWSTYKIDKEVNGLRVGKSDLTTGEVVSDKVVPVPAQTLNQSKGYCASGQTEDYFMPISMGNPGYISVVRKNDMEVLHHVYLEGTEADINAPYKFIHGTTSPDMKEYFVTLNESDTPGKAFGSTIGKMHIIVLDASALEDGKVKLLRKAVITGNPKSTVSFRQYFSPDGKYIANASGDILHIIDAKTLEVLDAETIGSLDQLHDAIFTPDGKYIVATSRYKRIKPDVTPKNLKKPTSSEFWMDGTLKLYSMDEGKFVGGATSVCLACHDEELGTGEDEAVHAILCGLDANWK